MYTNTLDFWFQSSLTSFSAPTPRDFDGHCYASNYSVCRAASTRIIAASQKVWERRGSYSRESTLVQGIKQELTRELLRIVWGLYAIGIILSQSLYESIICMSCVLSQLSSQYLYKSNIVQSQYESCIVWSHFCGKMGLCVTVMGVGSWCLCEDNALCSNHMWTTAW